MALEGLAAEVKAAAVEAYLLERGAPFTSDASPARTALFEHLTRGVTSEVVPLVGTNPPAGPRRDLAVRAITIGVAAEAERALWPEQSGQTDGRAFELEEKYERLLVRLGNLPDDVGTGVGAVPKPRGSFPPPSPYPDPAFVRPRRW